ncbi:MAG: tetratricopeptide repeat protein [Nitrospiraceae bacterium]|nr:tetratricopeptide repeat protein [Nitrospiraceae bacterium]
MMRIGGLLLVFLLVLPALSHGDEYYDRQTEKGIRNADTYAYLLIAKAGQDGEKALPLLREALSYDPDLPAVYFALARATFSFSGSGLFDSIDYVIGGIDAYARNFWWSFTLAGSLFFSLVISFVLAVSLIFAVRIFPDVPLLSHDVGEAAWKLSLLVATVALSAVSPLLLIGSVAVLTGLYMKKYNRIVVYMVLLFLFCYPLLSRMALGYLNAASSGSLKAVVQVNESENNDYAVEALHKGDDFASLFSYALALKREGRYDEAISAYSRLLKKKEDPRVYVDLGNCYIGLYNFDETKKGNLEEAAKYYQSALKIRPLVSAYYNLSLVSREMLDFTKGEEYFRSALSLDRAAVAGYRAMSARKLNRFVVDETLKPSELWDYAFRVPERFSTLGVAVVPPAVLSLAALLLGVAFFLLNGSGGSRAYRCRKCNKILCERCETRAVWGQMCPECYSSLIKLEEMDVRERVARLLSIYEQRRRQRTVLKALSFILPGLPEAYAGKILFGLIFLWPVLFLFLLPASVALFVPDSHLVAHGFIKWTSFIVAVMLYAVFHIITRKRIAKGWL